MKVEKNKVVSLSYTLVVDGEIADKATSDKPLQYIQGTNMLLPRFEQEVENKEVGDEVSFTLSPEEGYGVHKKEYVINLPLEAFAVDGEVRKELLTIGRVIPMLDSYGNVLQGAVQAVGEETVTMDFNHRMAGKTLNFVVKVEAIREATEKELTEGLHGEYLPKEEEECRCHKNGEGCCKDKGECHHEDGEHGHCCHEDGKEGECHCLED